MRKLLFAFAATLTVGGAFATGVHMKHTVTLKPGWNAFYLPISLTNSATEVFADWPVETVGFYDQTAFRATRQFKTGAADTTQGAIDAGMKMWKRGDLGHSSFDTLVANGVYVTVNTNRTAFTADLYGEPAAYRVAWHVSDGETRPVNFAGVSSTQDATLAADGYLNGLKSGWSRRWQVYGLPTYPVPMLNDISRNPKLKNGEVVAMDAAKVSDWSGVFCVSPSAGIALGTNNNSGVVSVRNDAFETRRVRVSFREGLWADGKTHLTVPTILYLDPDSHTSWQASLRAVPYARNLLPGETLKLRLAVDREKDLLDPAVGTEYGGIVDVEDVSTEHPSYFKTSIPFSAESDGGAFVRTRWPKGLWVANLTLDKVAYLNAESGGEESSELKPVVKPMALRLLVHVDANGAMNLLQRARIGGRRLSAPVLPTDTPVLPGSGTFGAKSTFGWTVAETSKVNPFRHAKHPDHDGLNADFNGPAPSGDDIQNYLQVVKPELFSVLNSLALTWNASTGAGWCPEETLSGACTWRLTGLRREGSIEMTGAFTMHRLSAADLEDFQD